MSPAKPRMRLGVYALASDGDSVLLTQLSDTEPEPDAWTLPGGGVDWGEHPIDALHRELYEETGLRGDVEAMVGINSHIFDRRHDPDLPPLHAVRLVYRMTVRGEPNVVEQDGSTKAAAWHPLDALDDLDLVDLVVWALEHA